MPFPGLEPFSIITLATMKLLLEILGLEGLREYKWWALLRRCGMHQGQCHSPHQWMESLEICESWSPLLHVLLRGDPGQCTWCFGEDWSVQLLPKCTHGRPNRKLYAVGMSSTWNVTSKVYGPISTGRSPELLFLPALMIVLQERRADLSTPSFMMVIRGNTFSAEPLSISTLATPCTLPFYSVPGCALFLLEEVRPQ